jgi:hypothetical protein
MAKPNRILEWEVVASDSDWEQQSARQTITAPTAPRRRLPSPRLVTIALVALLLMGVTTYALWRQAQAGIEQMDNEVALAVEAENWRAKMQPTPPAQATYDATANSRPLSTLEQLEFRAVSPSFRTSSNQPGVLSAIYTSPRTRIQNITFDDAVPGLAMVEVMNVDTGGNAYRETQFYRELDGRGWLRIRPDPAFWGAPKSLQTPHFQWIYRVRDAQAVTAVAAAMEQAYAQFRRDVGLPTSAPTAPINVEVRPAPVQSPVQEFADDRLLLPSPLLVVAPADLSQVEVLRANALALLAQYTLQLAEQEQPRWCIWRPLFPGLLQWQVHNRGGQSLVVQEMPASDLPSLTRLLESEENCLDRPVTQLKSGAGDPSSTAIAASLFAYVAERYGSDGIATLLAAFRHYATWDAALASAFDISAADFEAGWHEYALSHILPHR